MACSQAFTWRRLLAMAGALGALWAAAGCGGDGIDVVPVNGRVTVDGEPLHADIGTINFVPNKEKGNTTTILPTGYLDANGSYAMYYAQGKRGVPPGWYKVQIVASSLRTGSGSIMPRLNGPEAPPPLYDRKYTRAEESGLEINAVRSPEAGAYDLKLTK
jgi:hypothetical protein